MTENGGVAAAEQPAKKKGPFSGCLTIFGIFVVLLIVLVIVSSVKPNQKEEAEAAASASSTHFVMPVDSATVSKVKEACEAQLRAVAANSGRKIANVEPKPYEVVSVTFTGEVEQVDLPYKEIAWEVPLRVTNKFPNGSTSTDSETCRFRKLQQDAQMLNQ